MADESAIAPALPPAGGRRLPAKPPSPKPTGVAAFGVGAVLAVLLVALAGTVAVLVPDGGPQPDRPTGLLVGHEVIRTTTETYAPGATWARGPEAGLHQVTVLSGVLVVADDHGTSWDYRAGESFVAGWTSYTASNRTAEPVRAATSYLRPVFSD